jgi:uncharacterized membrane protein YkoI
MQNMKIRIISGGVLACAFLLCALVPVPMRAAEEAEKNNQATLKAEATVSKADAKKVALAEVKKRGLQHPKVKEAELEREKGLLVWSFDIATKGTKNITEVQVDAKTAAIVSVTTESAADEAKEKESEAKDKTK